MASHGGSMRGLLCGVVDKEGALGLYDDLG